jgi:hypothetical protein
LQIIAAAELERPSYGLKPADSGILTLQKAREIGTLEGK